MFRFEFQKLWIIYLVTWSTIFTLPPPVFSQYQSNYLRTPRNETNPAEPTGGGTTGPSGDSGRKRIEGGVGVVNVTDKSEGGAEPETSGSEPLVREALMSGPDGDIVVPAESYPHRRFRTRRLRPVSRSHSPSKSRHPHPPHSDPEDDEPRRPPRRHPPSRIHMKAPRDPGPREKPILLKPSKLSKPKKPIISVPKLRSKPFFERFRNKPQHSLRHEDSREQRERDYERTPPSPRVPATPSPPPSRPIQESMESSAGTSVEMKLRPDSVRHSRGPPSSTKAKEISKAILEQLFPSAQDGSILSAEKGRDGDHKSHSHSHNHNPQPHSASTSVTHTPSPFAHKTRPERPAEGYIPTDDQQELSDLWQNHHLRKRKECDGLENFIYDLEVISFLLGVVAALIGLYSDVIPFFNEGVKISYNNDVLGDGVDFPHDYWPKHDTHVDARTISIGTNQDEIKEVLSVTGEFIGLLGLGISFVGLFPSLVEKFFYSLDWWFGKRGLWKQYLYTYKCEVHKYPQPGWGKVG